MNKSTLKIVMLIPVLLFLTVATILLDNFNLVNDNIMMAIVLITISLLGFYTKIVIIKFPFISEERLAFIINFLLLLIGGIYLILGII